MIVILGPTGSGKTAGGIKLAKRVGGAVVSADSRQIYAGMNIGTATPVLDNSKVKSQKSKFSHHDILTPDLISGTEHYGFNIRQPNNPMMLAEWQQAAFKMIDNIIADGKVPLLVGGTGLYIDSVVDNYDIPAVGPDEQLRSKLEQEKTEALYARLIEQDPSARDFVEPANKRRIIRALEVIEATGRPFSEQRKRRAPRYDVEMIGIFPGWDSLRERVTLRARQMINDGLLEETRQLQEYYGEDLALLKTMNYHQAAAVLAGEMTEQEAREEMIKVNMRYARRQMSWWRRRKDIRWFTDPESAFSEYQ